MLEFTLGPAKFHIDYARKLVADVADDRLCFQPHGMPNHPAWQLGHLAWAADLGMQLLGKTLSLPGNWERLYAWGSEPTGDSTQYAHKEVLWHAFADGQARLIEAVQSARLEDLRQPAPPHPMIEYMPTIGDVAMHLMTSHIAGHLGQLRAWRAAVGLPRVGA